MLIVTCKRYLGRFLLGIKLLLPKLVGNLLHSLCHRYHQDFKTHHTMCYANKYAANIKSIPGLGGGNYGDFFPLFLCSRSRKLLLIVSCHRSPQPAAPGTVKAHSNFSWHSQCRHETEREREKQFLDFSFAPAGNTAHGAKMKYGSLK